MKAGERFLLQSAAGGGFGDPRIREPEALRRDLAEGYVTADAAKEDYGDGQ
jgi:N-methylhydantoinase B